MGYSGLRIDVGHITSPSEQRGAARPAPVLDSVSTPVMLRSQNGKHLSMRAVSGSPIQLGGFVQPGTGGWEALMRRFGSNVLHLQAK